MCQLVLIPISYFNHVYCALFCLLVELFLVNVCLAILVYSFHVQFFSCSYFKKSIPVFCLLHVRTGPHGLQSGVLSALLTVFGRALQVASKAGGKLESWVGALNLLEDANIMHFEVHVQCSPMKS